MKAFFASVFAAAASASAIGDLAEYLRYIAEHGKTYEDLDEFTGRAELFFETDKLINEHNATNDSFTLGHNQFSDMTENERSAMLGYRPSDIPEEDREYEDFADAPSNGSKDWRGTCVTGVKDQGQCGSCWAFSSTGAIEGAECVKTGKLYSFSEQQLVDCDRYDGGCNGGNQNHAFKYLESNPIIEESVYRYTGRNGTCKQSRYQNTGLRVRDFTWVTPKSPNALKSALDRQPVSVSIEADRRVFQQYSSGIFNSSQCGTSLDHAVLLVGYGSSNGQEYYILKNSWAKTWGERGYMRIAVTSGAGICGVQKEPLFPNM